MSTQNLLYILPEMAFTTSLEETSKSNYFFAQSFHQINGEFIADENFLLENLKKLFERVEAGEYTLILPDFLFTDTIVTVPKTDDREIAVYLRNELLPKINVSTFTHETCTSVLLQRGKTSKVQLSALEKELAAQIQLAIGNHQVKIKEIVPLSWTLKAAVSLEPSITIAQLGESLYLAEHFVGINQTSHAKIDDLNQIEETVKTLKGADTNLQTIYLFTSGLVEEKLKKDLAKILPIQQLVETAAEEAQIPSYVKEIVEIAGRTLSLSEFVVPRFSFVSEKEAAKEAAATEAEADADLVVETMTMEVDDDQDLAETATVTAEVKETEVEENESEADQDEEKSSPAAAPVVATALVSSVPLLEEVAVSAVIKNIPAADPELKDEANLEKEAPAESSSAKEDDFLSIFRDAGFDEAVKTAVAEEDAPAKTVAAAKSQPADEAVIADLAAATIMTEKSPEKKLELGYNNVERAILNREQKMADTHVPTNDSATAKTVASQVSKDDDQDLGLSFFARAADDSEGADTDQSLTKETALEKKPAAVMENKTPEQKAVPAKQTKQKGEMNQFLKKFFLFILIFIATIAIGIGVGLLILKISGKDFFNQESLPTPEPTVLPTALPVMPEASEAAAASASAQTETEQEALDPADFKILVVNATGVAGYAGTTKTSLEKEGFVNVKTGNSKGTYADKGTFVLMEDKNSALIKLLESGTGATLIYDEDYQTEDPSGTYDAVIVLNDKS